MHTPDAHEHGVHFDLTTPSALITGRQPPFQALFCGRIRPQAVVRWLNPRSHNV